MSIGLGPASDNRILNRGRFITKDNRNKAAKKGVVPATRKPDTLHMSPTQILVANQKRSLEQTPIMKDVLSQDPSELASLAADREAMTVSKRPMREPSQYEIMTVGGQAESVAHSVSILETERYDIGEQSVTHMP